MNQKINSSVEYYYHYLIKDQVSCIESWLHWYYKTQTISHTFSECRTQTSTVNKRLHSVLDKSEVLEEDSPSLPSESLKSAPIRDQEKLPNPKSPLSVISLPDQPSITFQNGFWTDKRTQETELGLTLFPINLIPLPEMTEKEWERSSNIEVSDPPMDGRLEDKEQSQLVEEVQLLVLPERSE